MKKILTAILACSMLLSLAACSSSSTTETTSTDTTATTTTTESTTEASADPIVIKIATILTTGEPTANQITAFAERVTERTDGAVEVQVYHDGSLYSSNNDIFEAMLRGGNVMAFADPAKMADYVPDYAIMQHPYLYNEPTDIQTVGLSDWGQEMVAEAAEAGIRVLDSMTTYYGTRHTISTEAFTTPEEMAGIQVRVPSTTMWISTITAMGGNPTIVDWGETYSALSQGVADAAEGPLTSVYAAKFHEVATNLILTGHFIAPGGLEMSEEYFQTIPEEYQAILIEEAELFAELSTAETMESEAEMLDLLISEGVTVIEPDVAAFTAACANVYQDFPEWTEGAYDRVKAIIAGN